MIDTTHHQEQRTAENHAGSRRTHASSARRRHAASFSDAVIAAYIHELRHAELSTTVDSRRVTAGGLGDADRAAIYERRPRR